ncbi:MAG: TPM domain-containing protein [Pseudomonadota bacterium]|jgi:uncharacterized membrane protein
MDLKRILKHLTAPDWITRRAFPEKVLAAIENAIRESEKQHRGELRFVVEAGLDLRQLLAGMTPHERAVEVFSQLRVWDTAHNSGVLIYVQFVDRCTVILADRGIAARVEQNQWDDICRRMDREFHAGRFEQGALAAIGEITALLRRHFPVGQGDVDELANRPVIL